MVLKAEFFDTFKQLEKSDLTRIEHFKTGSDSGIFF